MRMTDLLSIPGKICLLLGLLCFKQISALDFVEVKTNGIEMNSSDELICASVVSSKKINFCLKKSKAHIFRTRFFDMVIETLKQCIRMIHIKMKSIGPKDLDK